MKKPTHRSPLRRLSASAMRQKGISLLVVMVMLLVSAVAVLGASRFGWLGESVVGNEADYQRARAAADAMMADAMIDVMGWKPTATGGRTLCNALEPSGGCRRVTLTNPFIPQNSAEIDDAAFVLEAQTNYNDKYPCLARATTPAVIPGGLCIPQLTPIGGEGARADWWNDSTMLAAMLPLATTYGGATGNQADPSDAILTTANNRAFYWLEVFRYTQVPGGIKDLAAPELEALTGSAVVRITVLVQGLKPNTRVVLQSLVVHPSQRA